MGFDDLMAKAQMYDSCLFDIFGDQNTIEDMDEFRQQVAAMGGFIYHQRGKKGIRVHFNGQTIPRAIIDLAHTWEHGHRLHHAYGPWSPDALQDPEPTN